MAGADANGFVFDAETVNQFLRNKHVVFIGDSIVRGMYKDLVLLLQEDRLLTNNELEKKVIRGSFMNDKVISLTPPHEKVSGINFYELREYRSADGFHLVQYYFVTKCYYDRVEGILESFLDEPPDIVVMNSCLWDISRYGHRSEEDYLTNMATVLKRMQEVLPPKSMFLWMSTPPVSSHIAERQFLREEIQFLSLSLRKCVLEINHKVAQLIVQYGFDNLDVNYYLRPLVQEHRKGDGVHWDSVAHRHITELLLLFLYDSWGEPLKESFLDIMKMRTNMRLDLKHLADQKQPSFVKHQLRYLNEIAEGLQFNPPCNTNKK
uniref:Uncharacterized protein n=1 Tax=Plectus sambesii TaxID=2011161 RepID=A0A914WPS6_9BILA